MAEAVPVAVGRVRIADCAVAEDVLRIEIAAVASRVGKHAVQNDPDILPVRFFAQGFEIFLRAEHRVDALVIGGIVAVVGIRHEDRVQIQNADAERFQIRQLLPDAVQVAAEEVAAPVALRVRRILRLLVPVFMDRERLQLLRQVAVARAEKAVGQDLIHHRALREIRDGEVRRDHAELPFIAVFHVRLAAVAEQPEAAVGLDDVEPVIIQPALLRGEIAAVDIVIAVALLKDERRFAHRLVFAVFQHQLHADAAAAARQENP